MSEKELEVQRHGMMNLASSTSITLIGFLATIFYAHWVGAGVLGTYFVFLSLYSILCFATDLGIAYAVTQRISEGKDQDRYYSAGFAIRVGAFIILALGLILFRERFVDLNQAGLFWVLLAVLGLGTIQSCVNIAIGASNRLGLAATTTLINNIARILIQVVTVFLGYQISGLVGGLAAGILIQLLIEVRFVDYHLKKFQWAHVKSLFSFSGWAVLISAGNILFDNISLIIIAYFLPVADVGIYGVCWTFSFFALFVSTALVNTLYVKVSRWNAQEDRSAITIALSRATTYSLIFALPILIGGILLGYNLLFFLYGASFSAGANALIIIIAMRVLQSIANLYTNFLLATDQARQAVVGITAGIGINCLLCILLVPMIGISGAAIAAFVNVCITFFIARSYLSSIIPLEIERPVIRDIILATALMTGYLIMIMHLLADQSAVSTILMVLSGAGVYFLALLILNLQIREDAFRILKIKWI